MKYIEIAKKNRKRILSSILCAAMIAAGIGFTPAVKVYAEENTSVETVENLDTVETEAGEDGTIEEVSSVVETEEASSDVEETTTEEASEADEEFTEASSENDETLMEETSAEEMSTEETSSENEEVTTEVPASENDELTTEEIIEETAFVNEYDMNDEIALFASNAITFDYNSYPYGIVSGSTITLTTVVKKGTPQTIEWYYSDSKNGDYTLIEGANELSYIFTAQDNTAYWYKCSVNGYETEAVQVIYGSKDASGNRLKVYSRGSGVSAWYISNGTMAYTSGNDAFDVVGTYTYTGSNDGSGIPSLVGQTIWISTSYRGGWTRVGIKQMICTFSPDEPHAVLCTAILDDSSTQFGLYADVCLGSSDLFGSLADNASLKAIIEDGRATQIQMVGAATVDDAKVTDPAFVLQCVDTPTSFYMGYYDDCRGKYYVYNTNTSGSGVKNHEIVNGTDVVTEVAGIDSGFAMGWTGVAAGGTVRFNFNIGSVEQAGAQIKANSQVTSTTITVTQEEGEIGSILFRLYDKTTGNYTEWMAPDETGKAVFKNLTPNHTYEIQAKKKDDTDDKAESMGDSTTAIDPLKPGSGSTGGAETPEVEVNVTYNTISFKNLSSEYQYRLVDEEGNAETRWSSPSGDDNSVIFEGLYPGKKYYLVAKSSDNSETDKVEYTTEVMVLHYDANTTDEVSNVPQDQTFSSGNVLSSLIPERTGYDFLGWNLEEDKDSDEAAYKAGEPAEDVNEPTLYACWKLKTFSVNINTTEHYTISRDSETAGYGSDYTFKIVPVSGYALSNVQVTVNGEVLADDCVVYDADAKTYTCTIKNVIEEKNVAIAYDYTSAVVAARNEAKAFLDKILEEYSAEIDNMENLSEAEKNNYKESLKDSKEYWCGEMDAVTAPDETYIIDQHKQNALMNMDSILSGAKYNDLARTKENAKAEVERAANEAKAKIDEMSDLSLEEAELAKSKVDEWKNNAFESIEAATDIDHVFDAKNTGIDNITVEENAAENLDLDNAKAAAISQLDADKAAAEEKVNALTDLTEEEKTAALAEIEEKYSDAKTSITEITDHANKSDIASAKVSGSNNISEIQKKAENTDLANAKNKAEGAITDAVSEAFARIDAMADMTDEDKEAVKSRIDGYANSAMEIIDSVAALEDKSTIIDARDEAINAINAEVDGIAHVDFEHAKDNAKAEIDKKAEEAKANIDSLTDLTEEEKTAAKAKVDEEAKAAKEKVDAITSPESKSEIEPAKESGSVEIVKKETEAANTDLGHAKDNAKAEIDKKAEEAKNLINSYGYITPVERDNAKKDIDEKAALLKDNIDSITAAADKNKVLEIKLEAKQEIESKRTEIADLSTKRIEENKKSDLKYDEVKNSQVKGEVKLDYGNGRINVSIESKAENVNKTDNVITGVLVSSYQNIVNACLDAEEQKSVADGQKIDIRLTVTSLENVPVEDKTSIEKKTEELANSIEGLKVGDYIDLHLEKRIGSEAWEKISETNEDIVITIDIPDDLKKSGAAYSIMRYHDGECTLLEDLDDNPDTITIKTGKFSTYAILYSENTRFIEAPSTGNTANSYLWFMAAAMLIVGFTAMGVGFTRKKECK